MKKEEESIAGAVKGLLKLRDKSSGISRNDVFKAPEGFFDEPSDKEDVKLSKKLFWKLWLKHSEGKYIINKDNSEVVYTIFRYFTEEKDFDKKGIVKNESSLDKGLLIYGGVGVGKTFLFDVIHKIGKDLIQNYGYKKLWFNKAITTDIVNDYVDSHKNSKSNFSLKNLSKGTLYLDDLAIEEKAYNRTEIIADIMFERHRLKSKTFATTNLFPSEIGDKYGARFYDRMIEMFNIIKWEGKSFRK